LRAGREEGEKTAATIGRRPHVKKPDVKSRGPAGLGKKGKAPGGGPSEG